MSQAIFFEGVPNMVDYTPSGAVTAGDVVVIGTVPTVAHADIAANELGAVSMFGGVYKVMADGAMTEGQRVYWDDDNNKVTLTAASNYPFGFVCPGQSATLDEDYLNVYHIPETVQAPAKPVADATITVGAEGGNVINVAIQLEDADGDDIAVRGSVMAYLSDDANGDSIAAVKPSGGVAIGTDGLAIELQTLRANAAVEQVIPLTTGKVFDALATDLPAAAANDDMGIVTGTPGTDGPTLQGVDCGGTTSDEKASFLYVLPDDYVSGAAITVRAHAGMLLAADTSATLDLNAYLMAEDGTVGSDICATAAQSIKSATLADKDFTITPTGLVAGDTLVLQLSFAATDSGNAGDDITCIITKLSVLVTKLTEGTDSVWQLVSEADGDIDLNITETSVDTWYLIVILPDGTLVPSGAITFA